jgi:hypothetical protein
MAWSYERVEWNVMLCIMRGCNVVWAMLIGENRRGVSEGRPQTLARQQGARAASLWRVPGGIGQLFPTSVDWHLSWRSVYLIRGCVCN